MRIGGAVTKPYHNPEEWIAQVRELAYSTVSNPVDAHASSEEKKAYMDCIRRHDLTIGEVGVWKNTLSPDDTERRAAVAFAKEQLALAEELGAACCVNISGARGEAWDGCYAENYTQDAYTLLVDTVREIIDSVKPKITFYTLEPMPWMHPDSPDDYLRLIHDIDRTQFGVHLDYANLINSIQKYIYSSAFVEECFEKLGPYIKSIHAKDVALDGLPCRLRECNPGMGTIDFANVLRLTQKLGEDTPLFVEHMSLHEEFLEAVDHLRKIADREGIPIKYMKD